MENKGARDEIEYLQYIHGYQHTSTIAKFVFSDKECLRCLTTRKPSPRLTLNCWRSESICFLYTTNNDATMELVSSLDRFSAAIRAFYEREREGTVLKTEMFIHWIGLLLQHSLSLCHVFHKSRAGLLSFSRMLITLSMTTWTNSLAI